MLGQFLRQKWKFSSSLLLVSIWAFIRFGSNRITTTFDESYYLSTLKVGGEYSGLVTPFLLRVFDAFTGEPVVSLLIISVSIFVIYYFAVAAFHRKFDGFAAAEYLLMALLLSSHYTWSANEVRPQQIGLLFGLALLLWVWKVIDGSFSRVRSLFLGLLLWAFLMVSHVLSFAVFLILSWALLLYAFLTMRIGTKDYALLSMLPAVGAVTFFLLPPYRMMVFSIKWLLKHSSLSLMNYAGMHLEATVIITFLLAPLFGVLIRYEERGHGLLRRSLNLLINELRRRRKLYFNVAVVLVLSAILFQFYLGAPRYSVVYGGKMNLLLLMQMGNIIFAVLLLRGLFRELSAGVMTPLALLTSVLLLLEGGALLLSVVMPKNFGSFGFTNWAIRVYQYLVVVSAPYVASELGRIFSINGRILRRMAVALFIAGIMTSVINVARPPAIYNYPYYWTKADIQLVSHVGPGLVYVNGSPSLPFNSQALSFLGWAYGVNLHPVRGDLGGIPSPDFCVAPLCHSPYPYRALALSTLNANEGFRIMDGTAPKGMTGWIDNVIGNRSPALNGTVELIVGNSTVNPLIARLESEFLLPVQVNYSVVTGPTFRYYQTVKAGEKEGDVRKGYFVIEFVEVNGTPVLVVEGVCWDAMAAGVWFLANKVLRDPKKWDYSWIVGEWEESDGKVLPFLRFYPEDKNGFSYGDRIKIVTAGKP